MLKKEFAKSAVPAGRQRKNTNKKGQSLIEILVAFGLLAVILPALLTAMISSREGKAQEEQRLEAMALLREAQEATRSVREKNWAAFATSGVYHPKISGSSWILAGGGENINGYSRQIIISDVERDNNGNIVTGGTIDASTKKVVTQVSWTTPNAQTISETQYLTRHVGNSALIQTTQADFDGGTKNNVETVGSGGGTVQLKAVSQTGGNFSDDYTNPDDYNFDSGKIEVTDGNAQLKNQGTPQTGQTANSGFNSNANGWIFASYGAAVSQSGSRLGSGGNPGGYVSINIPGKKNKAGGGYYYQTFTTTAQNPTATLNFDWKVAAYNPPQNSFHLYAWIDSGAGTPARIIWDSGNIAATTSWSSAQVDVAQYITSPGTYYLKVGAYGDFGNSFGGVTAGFDNVSLSWSGMTNVWASDKPTIEPTKSL